MKNLEKYMDELLEDTDCLNCVCCKLRLGYDPCKNEEDLTKEECDANIELNKKWLKADYVSKEALYILRGINLKFKYIRRDGKEVHVCTEAIYKDSFSFTQQNLTFEILRLDAIFKKGLFDFLPSEKNILISSLLEQYNNIY